MAATVSALSGSADGTTSDLGGGREVKFLDAILMLAEYQAIEPVVQHREVRWGDQRREPPSTSRWRAVLSRTLWLNLRRRPRQVCWIQERNGGLG